MMMLLIGETMTGLEMVRTDARKQESNGAMSNEMLKKDAMKLELKGWIQNVKETVKTDAMMLG